MTNDSQTDARQARVGAKARFVPDPQAPGKERPLILSYLGMRELAGWVGVILPFAVALGNWPCTHALEGSISAYYCTRMGAWFAGSLWVIGFFMVSCRGYDKWDELSGRLAGYFALGVALLPMNIHDVKDGWVHYCGWLHWTCAALLFIVLALTSLFLFTKSDSPNPSPKKKMRNVWYRACGWAILACIAFFKGPSASLGISARPFDCAQDSDSPRLVFG
jgi:hypothetical protein